MTTDAIPAFPIAVTGGSTGIGAALVERLVARGVEVYVLDVTEPASGPRYVPCDLSDPNSIRMAASGLPDRLHALVNVAGIADAEPADLVVAVNFLGLREITETLLPRIAAGGTVVIVASSAGRDWPTRQDTIADLLATGSYDAGRAWLAEHADEWINTPYKFSKQAAAAYTYRAAALGRPHGVRVNCVNPGATETALTPRFRELIGSDFYDWIGAQVGRHGTPAEIAAVTDYLATGEASWLNGVEITVDGGYYAGLIDGSINPADAPGDIVHTGPSIKRS